MFRYFRRIDKQINETLKIYQDIGKLGFPFFKYILILVSFLIVISSLALCFSFFVENSVSMDANSIWINYSLPIIIYGVICPITSTLISIVFKLFLEYQISNIVNNYKYQKKKNGKKPNILWEIYNIIKFIFYSRYSLIIILLASICLLLPINNTIKSIFMASFIIFYILIKLTDYYNIEIKCYVSSIEKCYSNDDIFWRYNIFVKYPNEEGRIVKKRFNDFKKLHNYLDIDNNLPTSNWIKPNQINEVEERGKQLDTYIQNILTNKDIMANSLIYSFLKDKEDESQLLVLENKTIDSQIIDDYNDYDSDTYNNLIKTEISKLINEPIEEIFILHEINYYTAFKKRFFVICKDYLYKYKYDKFTSQFKLRYKLLLNYIYKVEKTIIINTNYLKNKDAIILYYISEQEYKSFILISLSNQKYYNIDYFYDYLKIKLNNIYCSFETTDEFVYDSGFGLSENLLHNKYTKNIKNMVTTNLLYSKSLFKNILY